MVAKFLSGLDAQVVVLVRLVDHLQLVHSTNEDVRWVAGALALAWAWAWCEGQEGEREWWWCRQDVTTKGLSMTPHDMHLIMGAVSLWTRPPALYLCTRPKKSPLTMSERCNCGTNAVFCTPNHTAAVVARARSREYLTCSDAHLNKDPALMIQMVSEVFGVHLTHKSLRLSPAPPLHREIAL